MRRSLIAPIVVAWTVVLGLAVGGAIDDHAATTVRTTSSTTTSTSWVETQPDLGPHFLQLVAAMKPKPTLSARGHWCGGDLPPCWVMMRESGGDIHAYNPTGCSGHGCYGKWQCDPTTCDGTGSEAEQDAEARRVWNHGRGCAHWSAC